MNCSCARKFWIPGAEEMRAITTVCEYAIFPETMWHLVATCHQVLKACPSRYCQLDWNSTARSLLQVVVLVKPQECVIHAYMPKTVRCVAQHMKGLQGTQTVSLAPNLNTTSLNAVVRELTRNQLKYLRLGSAKSRAFPHLATSSSPACETPSC